jgi:predicted N-acetyltransferase YhbS
VTLKESLRRGYPLPDRTGRTIVYRYLDARDDLDALTAMLHDAYAPLAAAGMRYVAAYQDTATMRERTERGETIVATDEGDVIGIVTLADVARTTGTPFYDRPDVAMFGQYAVRPSHQRRGIGAQLVKLVEERARWKKTNYRSVIMGKRVEPAGG